MYHATNNTNLTKAEQAENVIFNLDNNLRTLVRRPCARFSCNLFRGDIPQISPYASHHVVIQATDVLETPEDYLIPIHEPPSSLSDPSIRSPGGRTYIELLYIRDEEFKDDVNIKLSTYKSLQRWKLKDHPFIQSEDGNMKYRARRDLWWIILTPYKVSIPSYPDSWREADQLSSPNLPRRITNSMLLAVVRALPIFLNSNGGA